MTPVELKSGELIGGRYRVLRETGSAGPCAVYLALEESVNQTWAIKTLREEHGPDSGEQRRRLAREAELLGKLRHPCIPRLRETIDQDGGLLLVMDYVEGVSFAREIEQRGPLSWRETLRLAIELCGVLDYLHHQEKPLIYAKLGPERLRRKPDGSMVLLNFESVRDCGSAAAGEDADAEACAAPELYSPGAAVDERADLYALGATLFWLLTGQQPPSSSEERRRVLSGRGPETLTGCILKCMKWDPNLRYQSCEELLRELQAIQNAGRVISGEKRMQLACFFLCVAMTVLFGVGAIGARMAKGSLLRQQPPAAASAVAEEAETSGGQEQEAESAGEEASVEEGSARKEAEAAFASREAEESSVRKEEEDTSAPQEDESVPERENEEPEEASAPAPVTGTGMSGPESSSQAQEEDESSSQGIRGRRHRAVAR